MIKSITRYVVYGVHVKDKDTLIENHTDYLNEAVLLTQIMSCADFSAKIWDNKTKRYVSQRIINEMMQEL